jgi:hypothetical protein
MCAGRNKEHVLRVIILYVKAVHVLLQKQSQMLATTHARAKGRSEHVQKERV